MENSNLTRCPYTLKPLAQLAETNREHIILDSIGGPDGYSIFADKATNSALGATTDAAFQQNPIVAAICSRLGVKTRSGIAEWNLKGKTVEGQRPVEVTIPHKGPVEVYHVKPVMLDDQGKPSQIVAPAKQAEKLLAEMTKNYAKKGLTLSKGQIEIPASQGLHVPISINLTGVKAGLMKIAYLSSCAYIGDSFLDDPLNPEWQKAIRAQTPEEAERIKLHGSCNVEAIQLTKVVLPELKEHEHCIAIINVNQQRPVAVVRLFNSDLLTAIVQISDTQDFALESPGGIINICDALTHEIRREPWTNHLLRMSGLPPEAPS